MITLIAQAGFASLWMLAWGAAASIPILLHLLRRRHKQVITWGAMKLLQQVLRQESRRAHLRQWILLMMRVSVLILLALALARPFWSDVQQLAELSYQRPTKAWIVIVDTSYSMGYRVDQLSRLDRAKQRVVRLVGDSQSGDVFALIALGNPSRAVIARPTLDGERLLAEVQRLRDTAAGCDLISALTIADDVASEIRDDANLPKDVEIVILSDLGTDAWQSAVDGAASGLLTQLQKHSTVNVEVTSDSNSTNVAIESVQLASTKSIVGNPLNVDITVASYGSAVKDMPIQVELDGRILDAATMSIDAAQRQLVRLQVIPETVGTHVLSVTTPADNLAIDNRFDLVVELKRYYRVLIVEEQNHIPNPWELALRPPDATESRLTVESTRTVSAINSLSLPLKDWDLIVLDNPSLNLSGQLPQLAKYVESGGAAIVALGQNFSTIRSSDDKLLLQRLLGFGLTTVSEPGNWSVDPLEYASPVISAFAGFPNAGLLTTPIFRYWRIDQRESAAIVDLATTVGDPLIVRHRYGKGMVAGILSAPVDGRSAGQGDTWNAITTWPSFLPLAQQLASSLMQTDTGKRNVLAGEPISGFLPRAAGTSTLTLVRPDQTEVELTAERLDSNDSLAWSYADTDARGVYRVNQPPETAQLHSVNIDPIQSSLRSIDVQAIRALAAPKPPSASITGLVADDPGYDLWSRWLLTALGLLLVGESWFAWFTGRRAG